MGRGGSDGDLTTGAQARAEIRFLDAAEVERRYTGLLNPGKSLASALEAPRRAHHYQGERDLCVLAGTLLWSVTRAHALFDANKRASISTCDEFLRLNGYALVGEDDDLYHLAYDAAAGSTSADLELVIERIRLLAVPAAETRPFEQRYPAVVERLAQ